MSITDVCACVDEMPACDFCVRYEASLYAEYKREKARPDPMAGYKSDPSDIFVSEKIADGPKWGIVYNFTDKNDENPYHIIQDQDGGEECYEGEY